MIYNFNSIISEIFKEKLYEILGLGDKGSSIIESSIKIKKGERLITEARGLRGGYNRIV